MIIRIKNMLWFVCLLQFWISFAFIHKRHNSIWFHICKLIFEKLIESQSQKVDFRTILADFYYTFSLYFRWTKVWRKLDAELALLQKKKFYLVMNTNEHAAIVNFFTQKFNCFLNLLKQYSCMHFKALVNWILRWKEACV